MEYSLDDSLLHLLHRASQVASDIFAEEQRTGSITPRQFVVLAAVASSEGLNQTEIVDRTGIDRSTMADIVRRLLRKGLLSRKRTIEDERAYAVKLTAQGQTVLEQTRATARRSENRLLAALATHSQVELIVSLHKLIQVLQHRPAQK